MGFLARHDEQPECIGGLRIERNAEKNSSEKNIERLAKSVWICSNKPHNFV